LGLKNLLRNNIMKNIIYIDMVGVISDFEKERKNNPLSSVTPFIGRPDKIPNIYKDLEPIEGSIESVTKILKLFFIDSSMG